MLLVKKCIFFLELFSVKIRLEIMFNYVTEGKETFFGPKKCNLSTSRKSHFSKGVNPCFWSKNVFFFLKLFSVKIRPKILLNSVRDKNKTFSGPKKCNLWKSQKSHFSKGVNPCFWSKNVVFFLALFSVKIRLEIMFNYVIEGKETFFDPEKCNLSTSQKSHLSKGVNPCFWSENVP